MKKIALLSLALSSLVFADDKAYQEKISKLVSEKTQREISVKNVFPLDGSKDLKVAILYDKKDKAEIAVLATQDGNVIVGLSNIFLSKSEKDLAILADAYKATQPKVASPKPEVLDKLFSSIPEDRMITFTSSNKDAKQTYYIISDPKCPACRRELDNLETKLQSGDVKMVLVSFLGQESAYKAKLIYSKLAKVKDNAIKLQMMREIYSPDYRLTPKDKKQDIKMIEQNTEDAAKAGIQSVPFVHIMKK